MVIQEFLTKDPPQPKCTFIWDIELVQEFLRNLLENNFLSDKTRTLKFVLLLALTSASTASKVAKLDLQYLTKSQSVYVFLSMTKI